MSCDGSCSSGRRLFGNTGANLSAAVLRQDITAQVEDTTLNVTHVDTRVPKSHDTEQHQNILGLS